MASAHRPPLDELMIVNPGTPAASRALILRRASNTNRASERAPREPEQPERRFFLGSDGTLYEVVE